MLELLNMHFASDVIWSHMTPYSIQLSNNNGDTYELPSEALISVSQMSYVVCIVTVIEKNGRFVMGPYRSKVSFDM